MCVAVHVGDDFPIDSFDNSGVSNYFIDVVPVHGGHAWFLGGVSRQNGQESGDGGIGHGEGAFQRSSIIRDPFNVSYVTVKVQAIAFPSSRSSTAERGVFTRVVGSKWVDAYVEAWYCFAGSCGGKCACSDKPDDGTGDPRKCQ